MGVVASLIPGLIPGLIRSEWGRFFDPADPCI